MSLYKIRATALCTVLRTWHRLSDLIFQRDRYYHPHFRGAEMRRSVTYRTPSAVRSNSTVRWSVASSGLGWDMSQAHRGPGFFLLARARGTCFCQGLTRYVDVGGPIAPLMGKGSDSTPMLCTVILRPFFCAGEHTQHTVRHGKLLTGKGVLATAKEEHTFILIDTPLNNISSKLLCTVILMHAM